MKYLKIVTNWLVMAVTVVALGGLFITMAGAFSTVQAQSRYGHGYYSHGYNHYDNRRSFVRGAVAGAIVGAVIYDATRYNSTVYVTPISPVYRPVDPTWYITYVATYSPDCGCTVYIKQYQDGYGNYHPYP